MAARTLNRLSARKVETLKEPGRHSDGGGLYLVVDPSGAKRWVFIFRWKQLGTKGPGRLREMGIGSFLSVGLAEARDRAAVARNQVANRIDPIAAKKAIRAVPTFGEMADEFIVMRTAELRSAKSVDRLKRALVGDTASIRSLRIDHIETDHIMSVLQPIWLKKPDSAKNTRGYIEAVIDAAKAKGYRSGDNPARWRGHLDHLLARPRRLSRGHHAAMAYTELPGFVRRLHERKSFSALALEFLILCAARTGEVIGAKWTEIDLSAETWTIPGPRMKAGRVHRVPLSGRALEVLAEMRKLQPGDEDFVFPGRKPGSPLSNMVFDMLLRRMEAGEVTTHGFRSSFRDWAGEATEYPRELAEEALAHSVGDATERAYRRRDALERRRLMMAEWTKFCLSQPRERDQASSD